MKRARHQGGVTPRIPHPFQIQSRQHSSTGQQPDVRQAAAKCLDQPQIHTDTGTDSTYIQDQDRSHTAGCRLLRQAHRFGPGASGVLHGGMKHRVPQAQVEAEHDPVGAHQTDDGRQVGKCPEGLQPNHHVTGATGEHFQRALRQMSAGVHHQGAGKAGVKLGQFPQQCPLDRSTLNGIEIRDITFVQPQNCVERPKHGHRVAQLAGCQIGLQRCILGAISGLRVNRNSTGNVQYGNDLHPRSSNPGCRVTYSGSIVGWDIGGVNTKATRLTHQPAAAALSLCLPYELQRDPSVLGATLERAARQLGAGTEDLHAITMTAELSQAFRSKGEGVRFILDAVEATFPPARLHVYTVAGKFVSPQDARGQPLDVAASNWSATAHWLAIIVPSCVLIDIGTTTTDIIPILDGEVCAQGRTDPDRLGTGELVYTGVLRTPVEAVTHQVPLRGRPTGLASEAFALMGDVFLWLGILSSEDYTCPTPDGRPAARRFAGERLARAVCADAEMLNEQDINGIAAALAHAQLERITEALRQVRRRHPQLDTAIVTGLGAFLGLQAGSAAGLGTRLLSDLMEAPPQTAAATAVAWLLHERFAVAR